MLQTPDNVTSFRTQSMPKSTAAKEEPSVIEQKENQPEVKRPEVQEIVVQDDEPESNFFLTGVNVQNQDIEQYALMDRPAEEEQPISERVDVDQDSVQDEQSAGLIDKYKMLAVVDAGRSFANNEVSGDSNVVNNDFFY